MRIFEQLERRRHGARRSRPSSTRVQRVADEVIAPSAAAHDKSGEFPNNNVAHIKALGLNGLFVPEAYGGSPARYKLYLAVVKILSEACASTGIIYATNFHAMKPLIDFGSEEQKQRLLPRIADGGLASLAITEPEAGSDATGMRTRFPPDGDYIVVDGGKTFITNGDKSRPAAGIRQVERDRRRQGSHLGAGAGEGHVRASRPGAPRTRWACAPPRRRRSPSTSAACRAPTCWASRATA